MTLLVTARPPSPRLRARERLVQLTALLVLFGSFAAGWTMFT